MGEKIKLSESHHKIIYRDGDKLYKTFSESYNISQILNEALNQAKVHEAGIHTPKVFGVGEYEGRNAIIMEYIDGEDLFSLLKKDKSKMDENMERFTKIHHEIMSNQFVSLINSYGKTKNKIFNSNLPANIKYSLFYKLRELDFTKDIIHGDFILSNVIIDKKGDFIVVDWAHAAYGNRKFDIAVSYALMDVLDGKNDIAECYIEKMCKLENVNKEQIFDLLPLAYVYIVDRFDDDKQKEIYDKIYQIIKLKEG